MAKYFSLLSILILSNFIAPANMWAQNQSGNANISHGPIYGGTGGNPFSDSPNKDFTVYGIKIRYGFFIDSIQIIYNSPTGLQFQNQHGGNGGIEFSFFLNPGEYITGLSVRYGKFIDALRIHTNKRVSPFFGGPGGSNFQTLYAPNNQYVIGFHGRSGVYLDAIGIISLSIK